MNNPLLDRMKSRQKARRLDTAQRYGMFILIGASLLFAVYELVKELW